MIFPKKQGQKLIPEYLLDYATQLNESHPDPTESWGGSGGNYTAGDGININDTVISVDDTIAKKSEIPTNYVTLDTEQTITKSKTITSRLNIGSPTGNNIFIDGNYGNSQLISMYNDTLGSELSMMIDNGNVQGNTGAYFTYEDDKGLREYRLPYQDTEGRTTCTLATNLDIPTKTSELTNDSGFITSTALNNYVTTDTNQAIVGDKTFAAPVKVISNMLSRSTQLNGEGVFVYRDDVKDEVTLFGLPTSKTGGTEANPTQYTLATTDDIPTVPTLATVATTGSYNDLIDKPTIPDTTKMVTTDTNQTISGFKTFDSAKLSVERLAPIPIKLTFRPEMFIYNGGDSVAHFKLPTTKPKGTADAPTEYTLATIDDIPNATNVVTLDTEQRITGYKTFDGGINCSLLGGAYSLRTIPVGWRFNFNDPQNPQQKDFSLPIEKSGTEYTIATTDDIPTSATSTSTVTPTTETLVFTLSDNSTVTVNVMTGATVSTTTTLS